MLSLRVSGSPFSVGNAPAFLVVTHGDDHLYVADQDSRDIADFSISGNGFADPRSRIANRAWNDSSLGSYDRLNYSIRHKRVVHLPDFRKFAMIPCLFFPCSVLTNICIK